MTEPAVSGNETAGTLLRAAREAQGLHIAALAAAIKVTPRKLDALENNRWDELPDATFTRALALTVCRTLKIDARPVLALLPSAPARPLENVTGSLNAPFRGGGSTSNGTALGAAVKPLVWSAVALLIAAVVVFFVPPHWLSADWGAGAEPAVSAPLFPASSAALPADAPAQATPVPEAVAAEPAASAAMPIAGIASGPAPAGPAPAGSAPTAIGPSAAVAATGDELQIQTSGESWIEVRDDNGRVVLSRLVAAGEQISGLQGALPLRLLVGNAVVVRVSFRQKPVDLAPFTRDNVARLQLPPP